MKTGSDREVFRRSRLVLAFEGGLVCGAGVLITVAYDRLECEKVLADLGFALLPLFGWLGIQASRWWIQSWTFTGEGLLVIRCGFLPRSSQVIHLCSARQVSFRSSFLLAWLRVGHLAFRATAQDGRSTLFRWNWVGDGRRLFEILQAHGQLPPIQRKTRRPATVWMWNQVTLVCSRLAVVRRQPNTARAMPGRKWQPLDYQQFLVFCQMFFTPRAPAVSDSSTIPLAVARRWTFVLRQVRVLVRIPDRDGWQLAPAIHSLADIRRRIDRTGLERILRRNPSGS